MKQSLLKTGLGSWALKMRDRYKMVRTAISEPHVAGMLANDQIAGQLIVGLCPPGGVFLDIGAHIGSVSAEVLRHQRDATVHAFEAIPAKAEKIIQAFPKVRMHTCALAGEKGAADFFIHPTESGYSSLRGDDTSGMQRIQVELRKLDDEISDGPVDAIKIDVEGAELDVLQGGQELLRRTQPVIMFESGPAADDAEQERRVAIWQLLDGLGFQVLVPNRVPERDDGLSLEGFLEAHMFPRRTTNYFAVPRSNRDTIRARARTVMGRD